MTQKTLRKKLLQIKTESDNELEKYVIDDIRNQEGSYDKLEDYMKDVLKHGCISGMVSSLVYYNDTREFFAKYMDEIEEVKEEVEEMMGEPLKIGAPIYNWLAWFGYEQTMRKLVDKIGLEY